ncbi:hypothetical protein NQ315_011262 [Exocentrus adspersus]|uniref:RNase H type-1 domain-containing protein n=1 Tax=Exocentrus adspersus TaxID=1586481 RepID=A0AAV8V9T8_9CUCU|nr:hypothetical protein NQ315_011262 [Exocentrus adspersus]
MFKHTQDSHCIIKKAENAHNILKTFCHHTWGADPNITLLFYNTLVKSTMDYGSIWYDCRSAISKIKSATPVSHQNHIITDIVKLHSEAARTSKLIYFAWVKGHAGITDNEIVDNLAKEAAENGHYITFKIPASDLFPTFKSKIKTDWQLQYENSVKGTFFRMIHQFVTFIPWFANTSNKHFIKTICRMRSNHALYPQYNNRIGLTDTPYCICNEIADLQHMTLIWLE